MSRETVRLIHAVAAAALLTLLAASAAAQAPVAPAVVPPKTVPLPWLVLDIRGGLASLGEDAATAASLGVAATDLAGRARTAVVGAHVYPIRRGKLKLGLGAEMLLGTRSIQRVNTAGAAVGLPIRRRLEAASGQISLNFGRGRGWSYITVGAGPSRFESYLGDAKPTRAGTTTLNYGGGARWFTRNHLAFTLDLRFYLTRPATATFDAPARERQRVTLISAGISLK